MDVLTPHSLAEALRAKAERPDAVPIEGGTDVMVELNFDRRRPDALLNLNEVRDLKEPPLCDLLPALAEAARTVGSPQIRARGTIGGNLGTASPAGDALPPLLVEGAVVELASERGTRRIPVERFLVGPKRNALEP